MKLLVVFALLAGCSFGTVHARPRRAPAAEPCAPYISPTADLLVGLLLTAAAGKALLRHATDDHACDGPCAPGAERTAVGLGVGAGVFFVSSIYGFSGNVACRSAAQNVAGE